MILLLLVPVAALFVLVTVSLLTAPLTDGGLRRALGRAIGLYVGVTAAAFGVAWIIGKIAGYDPLGWWNRAWEEGDDAVLLVSGLHGSTLTLIPMLTMWRIYRSRDEVRSLKVELEFPLDLIFDEKKDRRGMALFLGGTSAVGFLVFLTITVTSAADLLFGTCISVVGTTTLEIVESGFSFVEDVLIILGVLISLTVISLVLWSGFTEDPQILVGLGVLFGLFLFFAWITGMLSEVSDYTWGPFIRMYERFLG